MKDFIIDIETLDVESSATILSLACIPLRFSEDFTFEQLFNSALYMKFDVQSQRILGRTIRKSTLAWWEKQSKEVYASQVMPHVNDVNVEMLTALEDFLKEHEFDKNKSVIWQRGSIDEAVVNSLGRKLFDRELIPYGRMRDIRTAIDILYGSNNGYCMISEPIGEDTAHDPRWDCARDAMMLKYGVQEK